MALEQYTGYIPALVDSNPTPTDPKSEGQPHLNGIKLTLSTTFAGFTEPDTGVTVKASDINAVCAGGIESAMPPGMVVPFACTTVPDGWLICIGQAESRTTYAALYACIGDIYGAGDGSTTFNLPDMRGQFLRGWSFGGQPDPGRTYGSNQGDDNKEHSHATVVQPHGHTATSAGAHTHAIGATAQGGTGGVVTSAITGTSGQMATAGDHTHPISTADVDVQLNTSGGTESRPLNVAMNYCVKT